MTQIRNLQGMTEDDLNRELQRGGKFVIFQYCFSVIIMTFKRGSDVYFIRPGESTIKHSIGYTLLTFFVGWWGIPWGPIYTIGSIFTNLTGGKDVTQDVINSFNNLSFG